MTSRIDKLMSVLTVEQKIGQLNLAQPGGFAVTGAERTQNAAEKLRRGEIGAMFGFWGVKNVRPWQEIAVKESPHGIPLIFGLDVIHGHQTVFPLPLALSCTWDMRLIEKSAHLAAIETAADGVCWTFSPLVDLCRDARWGRMAEGSGEDTYLNCEIAAAMVRGWQGDGSYKTTDRIMACVKSFALYGAPDGGRDYNTVDMSRIRMYETYLPPYKAAIDAGVDSVMTSFNDVDGIPASGNRWLMTTLLRDDWGFKGFVVTDYTAVNEMIAHGMGDLKAVSAMSLKAGSDLDMVGEGYLTTLKSSLDDGTISMEAINLACRRVLEAKEKLGLFDDPYRYCDEKKAEKILCHEHRAAGRDFAARSCVLLKNEGQALPLKTSGTIAVVGPLADDRKNMPGTWAVAGDWNKCVTLLEGIRANGGGAKIVYAKGANIINSQKLIDRVAIYGNNRVDVDPRSPDDMIKEAVDAAMKADIVVCAVGEAQEMTGESASRADIGIPADQRPLLEALVKTGKPLVLVIFAGRPLTLVWEKEHADAILMGWFGGSEGGNGIADVLFGRYNPAGKLTASFPYHVGQVPVYYNYKRTGRPPVPNAGFEDKFKTRYIDIPNEPLFPFGFGLSYTTFEYSDLVLSKTKLRGNETLQASVTVTNTGKLAGEEIVQLYITDPVASVTRAVKDLKGFEKIFLKPGEKREVVFKVTTEQLKFVDSDLKRVWEPGEFIIHIGPHSAETKAGSVTWAA